MSFAQRWLMNRFIDEPNRVKRQKIFEDALGTAPSEEIIAPLGSRFSVKLQDAQPGTGLLADIYNPANQARFASEMMRAPGGDSLSNAMMQHIQSSGIALDKMDKETNIQSNYANQARDLLYGAPQVKGASNIPMTQNANTLAATSPLLDTSLQAQESPVRNVPRAPTGAAADYEGYMTDRNTITNNPLYFNPAMKGMFDDQLKVIDSKWGYGEGATTSQREWRNAQRFNNYHGTFEDWKKMSRTETLKENQFASVSDLDKLMFPEGSKGYELYGKQIPYGKSPKELSDLGAVTRDEVAGEQGGKLTMLRTAQQQFPTIRERIMTPEGDFDNTKLWEMVGLDFTDLASFFVSPEAQDAYAAFEIGMQGITRVETGAAMPPEEIKNTRRRFMPKPWSSASANKLRWNAYQYFINNAENIIDPIRAGEKLTPEEATRRVNKAIDETFDLFGVSDEMEMPKELKPLVSKAKKEGISYTGHDNNYIYGIDKQGRKTRISR